MPRTRYTYLEWESTKQTCGDLLATELNEHGIARVDSNHVGLKKDVPREAVQNFESGVGYARSLRFLAMRQRLGLPVTPVCNADERALFRSLIETHLSSRQTWDYSALAADWASAVIIEWSRPLGVESPFRKNIFLKVPSQLKVWHDEFRKSSNRRQSIGRHREANALLRSDLTQVAAAKHDTHPTLQIPPPDVGPDQVYSSILRVGGALGALAEKWKREEDSRTEQIFFGPVAVSSPGARANIAAPHTVLAAGSRTLLPCPQPPQSDLGQNILPTFAPPQALCAPWICPRVSEPSMVEPLFPRRGEVVPSVGPVPKRSRKRKCRYCSVVTCTGGYPRGLCQDPAGRALQQIDKDRRRAERSEKEQS